MQKWHHKSYLMEEWEMGCCSKKKETEKKETCTKKETEKKETCKPKKCCG